MNSWSEGYRTDISYTYGYYREISPTMLKFALLTKRIQPPAPEGEPTTYCELAFGQGVSLAVHGATTSGCQFFGTDFNPAHAAQALDLHRGGGIDTRIYDDSFAEFSKRDLPHFDYICLHGIWSWVSRENQEIIIEFIRRHLKLGGVVYVSYNCLPGWAATMPVRRLLTTHARFGSPEAAGPLGQAVEALGFADKLSQLGSGYFGATPSANERLKNIREHNAAYVVHEYFNDAWSPQYFVDVADDMSRAKLEFAASAGLLDGIDAINFSPDARALIASVNHTLMRETLRDYLVNQQFRRDIFVRGIRQLSQDEYRSRMLETRFILLRPRRLVSLKFRSILGEVTMNPATYEPLLDALAADNYAPKTLAQLLTHPALQALAVEEAITCATVLTGAGYAQPCQPPPAQQDAMGTATALNRALLRRARNTGDIQVLASPVLGAGVPLSRIEQLFLLGRAEQVADVPGFVWRILRDQGQRLVKVGKTLETDSENETELTIQYEAFVADQLPLLVAQKVATS